MCMDYHLRDRIVPFSLKYFEVFFLPQGLAILKKSLNWVNYWLNLRNRACCFFGKERNANTHIIYLLYKNIHTMHNSSIPFNEG